MPPDPGGGDERPLLEVGSVVRAHGLRGEVVVALTTDRTERVAPGSVLRVGEEDLEVLGSRPHQGRHIVAFAGLTDRAAAEARRGALLRAPALDDPDTLWVHHLVGAAVRTIDGGEVGRVTAVEANPASDLLVLDGGQLVPLRFVTAFDDGVVTIDPPEGLLDLA